MAPGPRLYTASTRYTRADTGPGQSLGRKHAGICGQQLRKYRRLSQCRIIESARSTDQAETVGARSSPDRIRTLYAERVLSESRRRFQIRGNASEDPGHPG